MPFNLTFGMDFMFPIYFLIQTLQATKTLEWNGHELSERLEDLGRLDETRLTEAIAHMYDQRRRMKAYHDEHIISKIFKK